MRVTILLGLALARLINATSLQSAINDTTGQCSDPQPDSCSFYADCVESRFHCGPEGYPLGYGRKYCEKFSVDRAELSPTGTEWMLTTMLCLQRALVKYADGSENTTCDGLKDYAFSTHPRCYVDSGLCTLAPADWLAIVKIVSISQLFASLEAFKATIQAADGCLDFYLWLIKQGILDAFD